MAIVRFPPGMTADPSSDFSLQGLMSNVNAYAEEWVSIVTSGTDVPLTTSEVKSKNIILTAGASADFTVTLPPTTQIIDALGPTLPKEGNFYFPLYIVNQGTTFNGTLTAGDSNTTIDPVSQPIADNAINKWMVQYIWPSNLVVHFVSSAGIGVGGGVTEVDGVAPITTLNPTGPVVTVEHDQTFVVGSFGTGNTLPHFTVETYGHVTDAGNNSITQSDVLYGGAANTWAQVDTFGFVPGPGGSTLFVEETSEGDGAFMTIADADVSSIRAGSSLKGVSAGTEFASLSAFCSDSAVGSAKEAVEITAATSGVLNSGGVAFLRLHTQSAGFVIETDQTNTTTSLGPTAGLVSGSGSYLFLGNARWSKEIYAPATGFSHTIANDTRCSIANPSGTLATGTIKMPATPLDGQIVSISTTQTITTLTHDGNGKTISNALTTITAGQAFAYIYNLSDTTWYPVA